MAEPWLSTVEKLSGQNAHTDAQRSPHPPADPRLAPLVVSLPGIGGSVPVTAEERE